MRASFVAVLLSQLCIGALWAEKVTLLAPRSTQENPNASSETVVLNAGDSLELSSVSDASVLPIVKIGTTEIVAFPLIQGYQSGPTRNPILIIGPAEVRIKTNSGDSDGFATVEIKRAGAAPTTGPINTVVIPENSTGPITVILESSTDLLNWTPALPGTYSSATNRRFFRVRAVAP